MSHSRKMTDRTLVRLFSRAKLSAIFLLILLVRDGTAASATPADDKCDFPFIWEGNGVYRFALENDLFTKTDQYYTNGFKFNWVSPRIERPLQDPDCRNSAPTWMARRLSDLAGFSYKSRSLKERNMTLSWGQDIYTPANRDVRELIRTDRPYSAWMYLGMGINARENIDQIGELRDWHILHSLEVNVGIVGPSALGEQFQNGVHRARDIDLWLGWRNQLRDEPGIKITYERKYRPDIVRENWCGAKCDAVAHLGGTVGNVTTHANAGVEIRIGWPSLPDDFGTSPIRPGANGDAPLRGESPDRSGFTLLAFASASGRLVGRDVSLDGNTWKESHRVEKSRTVADTVGGVQIGWNKFKLSFFRAARSKEFNGQPDRQRFGGVLFSWDSRSSH
jgi:lipid A 3-O-deacylase